MLTRTTATAVVDHRCAVGWRLRRRDGDGVRGQRRHDAGRVAGGVLDRHHVILRREGPRPPAARLVRRVHPDVSAAHRRGLAADRPTGRGSAHDGCHRNAGQWIPYSTQSANVL